MAGCVVALFLPVVRWMPIVWKARAERIAVTYVKKDRKEAQDIQSESERTVLKAKNWCVFGHFTR
jgi:hypothetical protein